MKEVKNNGSKGSGRKEPKLELIMADDEFIAELR